MFEGTTSLQIIYQNGWEKEYFPEREKKKPSFSRRGEDAKKKMEKKKKKLQKVPVLTTLIESEWKT